MGELQFLQRAQIKGVSTSKWNVLKGVYKLPAGVFKFGNVKGLLAAVCVIPADGIPKEKGLLP